MESDGNPAGNDNGDDATRSDAKRAENAKPRGRPFEPGNQAAVGHGRPKKDWDIVTRCQDLSADIIEHYGLRGARAETGAEVEMGKVVVAYGFGKPHARHEHTGVGGGPIQIEAVRTTEQKRQRLRQIAREAAARVTTAEPPALPAQEAAAADEPEPGPEEPTADVAPGAE